MPDLDFQALSFRSRKLPQLPDTPTVVTLKNSVTSKEVVQQSNTASQPLEASRHWFWRNTWFKDGQFVGEFKDNSIDRVFASDGWCVCFRKPDEYGTISIAYLSSDGTFNTYWTYSHLCSPVILYNGVVLIRYGNDLRQATQRKPLIELPLDAELFTHPLGCVVATQVINKPGRYDLTLYKFFEESTNDESVPDDECIPLGEQVS